jgi:predicted KAP-like P-loop ATPase
MAELLPLSADRKLTEIDEDRLGYAPLAEHIARVIAASPHDEGLVIAVYAPWGAGKSTFLQFVRQSLGEREQAPVIVDFNPWWFSGEEDLAGRFFAQLALSLGPAGEKWKEAGKQAIAKSRKVLSNQIAELAWLASKAPLPYGQYVGMLGDALKRLKKNPRGIHEAKAETERLLASLDNHVLVLIDDVDRLTAEEIRQLFKVIKSVGDLKNVIYVVALDRQVAEAALAIENTIEGRDYLEKIIQVSFELPLPDRVALRSMFLEGVAEIVGGGALREASATAHWFDVSPALERFLETPRNVVTLLNSLRMSYPLVVGEVSVTDFLAIEALHVFMPEVWDLVRRSASYFTGASEAYA